MEGSGPVEGQIDPDELPNEIGVFELPLVLLPGELTPLHIFEPRYRALISECLADDKPFAFIYRDDADIPAAIGCGAYVSELIERLDDGRLNVMVAGALPLRVIDRFDSPEYPAARVEWINPGTEPAPDVEQEALRATLAEASREQLRRIVEVTGQEFSQPTGLEQLDAFGIGAMVEMPPQPKQAMLEAGGETERLRILADGLAELGSALERAQEMSQIAQTNGHGKLDH